MNLNKNKLWNLLQGLFWLFLENMMAFPPCYLTFL